MKPLLRQVFYRSFEALNAVHEVAKSVVAPTTKQASKPRCLMAMINSKRPELTPFVPRTFRLFADRTHAFLFGEQRVVRFGIYSETAFQSCVSAVFGVFFSPLRHVSQIVVTIFGAPRCHSFSQIFSLRPWLLSGFWSFSVFSKPNSAVLALFGAIFFRHYT